jgi:hypothetical protein
LFREDLPSRHLNLLSKIKHSEVSNSVRYSWAQPEEVAPRIEELFEAPASTVVCRTWGPVLITLKSGLIFGFGEQPSEGSVTLFVVKTEDGQKKAEDSLLDDEDAYRIDASDPIYSEPFISELVGQEITSVSIIKQDDPGWSREVAGEAGIILGFENGTELVIARHFCDGIDDLAICPREEIYSDILDQLKEISL